MAYYVKSQTRNGNTTEFNLNDLSDSDIYSAKFDLLGDCGTGFQLVDGKENAYSNGEIEIVVGEVLSSEEIQDNLLEIGETGSYKIKDNSLYTREEENADWLYCGEVPSSYLVDGIFASLQEAEAKRQETLTSKTKELAVATAKLFVDEYGEAFDSDTDGDWDATAWYEYDRYEVEKIGATEDDLEKLWLVWSETFIAETKRLAE